jgi:hypothetical protein
MVSPSHQNHLSRESVLERTFPTERGLEMIASRKRLGRSLKPTSKEMERRTWPRSIRPRREKERVPRVTMRGQPHSRERRRT